MLKVIAPAAVNPVVVAAPLPAPAPVVVSSFAAKLNQYTNALQSFVKAYPGT